MQNAAAETASHQVASLEIIFLTLPRELSYYCCTGIKGNIWGFFW